VRYVVIVADNYHYMDKDSEYSYGEYSTYEEAESACKRLVEDCLAHSHEPGMTVDKLWQSYAMFGCDPFIVSAGGKDDRRFSAWDYAKGRCKEICEATPTEA
jgi:hypothetical protein